MYSHIEEKMKKTLNVLDNQLGEIRAGRANPKVLDKILVSYYGVPTPINQMANIMVPEARMITIQPWDASILKDIEKDDEQLRLANGYDHNFVLNGKGYKKFATLEGESLKMDCFTDREGVQVYSGNFLNGKKGKGGAVYNFRSGICLETQSFPDFVNQTNFPYSFVNKNRPYASKTAYLLEEK